jgi:putative MFS transporter
VGRLVWLLVGVERHPVHAANDLAATRLPVVAGDHFPVGPGAERRVGLFSLWLFDRYLRTAACSVSLYFVGAFFHLWFAMASGAWLYVAAAAVGWVNPGVYGATGIYVSELHPTHLRATAVGWFFGIGRIGSFLAPTVVGFMLACGAGGYVLHTFALAYLISAIALWFIGIETKGRVLEQITEHDGLANAAQT